MIKWTNDTLPDFVLFARSTLVFLFGGGAGSDGTATAESVLSTFLSVSANVFFRDGAFRFGMTPPLDESLEIRVQQFKL